MASRKVKPLCGWGWNDQDVRSHSTNAHLAEAMSLCWVRISPSIVVRAHLCREHAAVAAAAYH